MRNTATAIVAAVGMISATLVQAADRPNILWITSEDNGPQMGCYGDKFADTPNLDRLAARGVIYTNAWSNAPVCAPARTTIISGIYPPSTGSEHMRSMTRLPKGMLMYPQYLRRAGYYCTNNSKEDYNLEKPGQVWDESSHKAHWRNRKPGQPFFAVFNFTISHESQIRKRPHKAIHDPARVRVPAYHPDTPEVRRDWAQYYDMVTEMDAQAGQLLKQLEQDGLADDTIIFYYGDHGPGMPRCKRWPYNSGLSVPLVVSLPPKWRRLASPDYRTGGKSDRLVGFIDLAPTLLSLVGIEPPGQMQGHAFLGKYQTAKPAFAFGFRGRMDERYDMVRVVRDQRYIYIRNYMPHKIYGQYIAYMFKTPTTQVWKRLYDEGKLRPPRTFFWETKPAEELYDLVDDPDEVHNLADSPAHQEVLQRLRRAHREWVFRIRDVGFLPEGEIHQRSAGSTPYEMGHDPQKYPLEKIFRTAQTASSLRAGVLPQLVAALGDEDSAVRYWGAMGILMRGSPAVAHSTPDLQKALADHSPYVEVAAAEALGRYGSEADASRALDVLLRLAPLDNNGVYVSMAALNAIDYLDDRAARARQVIVRLPQKDPAVPRRMRGYVPNLIKKILADLDE